MTGIVAIADSKAERSVKIDAAQALIMLYRVLISIDLARTCLTDDGKNILETEKTLLILSEFFIEGHNRLKPAQQQAALLIEALGENPTDEAERK